MSAHDRPTNVPRGVDIFRNDDALLGTRWVVCDEDGPVPNGEGGFPTRAEAWAAAQHIFGRHCPACGSTDLLRGLRDCRHCGWHEADRGPSGY